MQISGTRRDTEKKYLSDLYPPFSIFKPFQRFNLLFRQPMDPVIKEMGERIIGESFPLLKGKRILFISLYFRFYAFSAWIPPFVRLIVISTRARKFNHFVLTGIIAHELCHQERYIGMGFTGYMKFVAAYSFS
jgi:hypothetical protein